MSRPNTDGTNKRRRRFFFFSITRGLPAVTVDKLRRNSIHLNVIGIIFIDITCHVADYDTDKDRYERAQQGIVHVRDRVQFRQ